MMFLFVNVLCYSVLSDKCLFELLLRLWNSSRLIIIVGSFNMIRYSVILVLIFKVFDLV